MAEQPPMRGTGALVPFVEWFRWRVTQDALASAMAATWDRRAATFAKVGNPRCDATALACRRHAWLLRDTGLDAETRAVIGAALAEVEVA